MLTMGTKVTRYFFQTTPPLHRLYRAWVGAMQGTKVFLQREVTTKDALGNALRTPAGTAHALGTRFYAHYAGEQTDLLAVAVLGVENLDRVAGEHHPVAVLEIGHAVGEGSERNGIRP